MCQRCIRNDKLGDTRVVLVVKQITPRRPPLSQVKATYSVLHHVANYAEADSIKSLGERVEIEKSPYKVLNHAHSRA